MSHLLRLGYRFPCLASMGKDVVTGRCPQRHPKWFWPHTEPLISVVELLLVRPPEFTRRATAFHEPSPTSLSMDRAKMQPPSIRSVGHAALIAVGRWRFCARLERWMDSRGHVSDQRAAIHADVFSDGGRSASAPGVEAARSHSRTARQGSSCQD